jgi:hypothetical protein
MVLLSKATKIRSEESRKLLQNGIHNERRPELEFILFKLDADGTPQHTYGPGRILRLAPLDNAQMSGEKSTSHLKLWVSSWKLPTRGSTFTAEINFRFGDMLSQ